MVLAWLGAEGEQTSEVDRLDHAGFGSRVVQVQRYIGTRQTDEPGTCDNTFSPPNKYIKTHNKVFNILKKSNKCSNGDCPETTRK